MHSIAVHIPHHDNIVSVQKWLLRWTAFMKGHFLPTYNISIRDPLRFGLLVYIPHGGWVPKKSEHCNIVFKFPALLKFYTENMHYTLKFMRYAEIKDCRNKSDQAHTSTLG